MAKSLGQIHTVNYTLSGSSDGDRFLIDLPGELSNQLQHMVRMCSSFKVVGIDVTMTDPFSGEGAQSLVGELQYYAPTRGRVLALREAFQAVMRAMKIKGIKPQNNLNYDFRPPLEPLANYHNGSDFLNAASIQFDTTTLSFVELAIENNPGFQTVFDIWNAQIQPKQGTVSFSTGYDVVLGGETQGLGGTSTSPDFVLNEGEYLDSVGGHHASTEYETIPFMVTNSDGESAALVTNWRPDPALYLSVLMGQFGVLVNEYIDEANPGSFYELQVAVHVAGWKSVMRDRKRRKGGKSHGRKRTTRKSKK